MLFTLSGPQLRGLSLAPQYYLHPSYLSQLVLHTGIMPSFSLVLIGAAIATQVQATATTRTKVLTARLMAFSLHAGPLGAETLSGWIISPLSRWAGSYLFRCCEMRGSDAVVLGLGECPVNHVLEHRNQRF